MKRIPLFLSILSVAAVLLGGCQDEVPALEYANQGSIKGTITGSTQGNTVLNDQFTYSQYEKWRKASDYRIDGGVYIFSLGRGDFNTGGSSFLEFTLSNASDTSPDNPRLIIEYYKDASDKYVYFYMDSDEAPNTISITEFTFNPSTGQIKGKYSITGTSNTTGKSATVAGDFDLIAKRIDQ
jgi:hypothetical protein